MRIRLGLGRVADEDADVVVRCAPPGLVGRRPDPLLTAAGPDVVELCRRLAATRTDQEAVRTPAGALPARWLVHVVVPTYSPRVDRGHRLSTAYRQVLRAAAEVAPASLALAPLGTVAPTYWPLADAVRLGLGTLYGTPTRIPQIRLVLSSATALEAFAEAVARR